MAKQAIAEIEADQVTIVALDHVSRLNLVMLLGALEATVSEMRALWHLQDRLDLSSEEKDEIGWFTRVVNGNEVVGWDVTKSLAPKQYDLSDADLSRIRKALSNYPRHRAGAVRGWLEPLLEQAPALAEDEQQPQAMALNGRR